MSSFGHLWLPIWRRLKESNGPIPDPHRKWAYVTWNLKAYLQAFLLALALVIVFVLLVEAAFYEFKEVTGYGGASGALIFSSELAFVFLLDWALREHLLRAIVDGSFYISAIAFYLLITLAVVSMFLHISDSFQSFLTAPLGIKQDHVDVGFGSIVWELAGGTLVAWILYKITAKVRAKYAAKRLPDER